MTASLPPFFRSRRHIRSLFRVDDLHIIPLVSFLPLPGDWLSTTPDTAVAATTGVKPQPTLEQCNLQACARRNLRFLLNTTQSQSNYLGLSKCSQDPQLNGERTKNDFEALSRSSFSLSMRRRITPSHYLNQTFTNVHLCKSLSLTNA